MSVAYDLVIISNTGLGRQIALRAVNLRARVALVETSLPSEHWLGMAAVYQEILSQKIAPEVGSRWLKHTVANLNEIDSLAVLAALGIDIIQGTGEFSRLPRLAFVANNRALTARSYLLALGDRTILPDIAGIGDLRVYTKENISDKIFNLAPEHRWVVIGANATGVEFAQILHRFGARVTLATKGDRILPLEDTHLARWLQAQLEAEGIEVITRSPVEILKQIDDTKWVQAGDCAIETDDIFLAVKQYPPISNLNLEGVGLEIDRWGVRVNSRLQTTNPRIYALNSHQPAIAAVEGNTALYNALFFPSRSVNRRYIPGVVFSQPPLAQIGLTPAQAERVYGKKFLVLREYFKHTAAAQISGNLTGLCQIVVRLNGEIIGAQIWGEEAMTMVEAIAFYLQRRGKIQDLASNSFIYPTYSHIFARMGQMYREKHLSRQQWQAECLDKFFDWRRAWHR